MIRIGKKTNSYNRNRLLTAHDNLIMVEVVEYTARVQYSSILTISLQSYLNFFSFKNYQTIINILTKFQVSKWLVSFLFIYFIFYIKKIILKNLDKTIRSVKYLEKDVILKRESRTSKNIVYSLHTYILNNIYQIGKII